MSNKNFENALKRVNQSVPPIWFMRQAGRYHSHYIKLKEIEKEKFVFLGNHSHSHKYLVSFNFRDFKKYLSQLEKNEYVGMFCTGGIRCEKASNFLEKKGFKNVYMLKGGIINYFNKI